MSNSSHLIGLAAPVRGRWLLERGLDPWFERPARIRSAVDAVGRAALCGGWIGGLRRVMAASKSTQSPWIVPGPDLIHRGGGMSEDQPNERSTRSGRTGFGELRLSGLSGEGPLTAAELRAAHALVGRGVLHTVDQGNPDQEVAAVAERAGQPSN